jgi:hypothetical protein
MKVAQLSLPLSAVLLIGLNQSAVAGPQSMLDPYFNVKPPTKKAPAKKAAPVARPAAPTSVVINGPDLPPMKQEKIKKEKDKSLGIKTESSPEPIVSKSAAPTPIGSTSGGGAEGEGFLAGTKQIFKGFGTAAKGAVMAPTHALASGSKKMADGTKSIGGKIGGSTKGLSSKMADGTKSSGGIFVKGAKSVGNGFKAVGEKIKDGTVAATHAVPVPHLGGKKEGAEPKVADKPLNEKPVASPEKISAGGESLGGKVLAMPKTVGKGIAGAAAKTGEATKRVAAAPIGFFGKLNPFHKKDAAVQTAGSSAASKPPAQ